MGWGELMKHTPNYNLKKPELNEYVIVEDLNENTDIIDRELKENADAITTTNQTVATHSAEKASLTKEGHAQLSNSTTSTSDTLAATPSAVKKVMDAVNKNGYVTGIYTGNDAATRFINLGFTPTAVFVFPKGQNNNGRGEAMTVTGAVAYIQNNNSPYQELKLLEIVNNGFNVFNQGTALTNWTDAYYTPYRYIAFK